MQHLKGLYLITDETLTPYDKIQYYITNALEGGAKIIQFRDKTNDFHTKKQVALEIKKICQKYNAIFIVNDYLDLAIEVEADGIHIGRDDEEFKIVKKFFKNKIIGVSCYGDLFSAKEFEHKGASYVAFGSFFASLTKPNAPIIDINILKEAKKMLNIPICAIGGINQNNIKKITPTKTDMVAMISDIWSADNIKKKCQIICSTLGKIDENR